MPQVQARFRSHFEAHLPILLHLSVNPYGCAFFYRKVSLILYFTDILQGCVKHQECSLASEVQTDTKLQYYSAKMVTS